MGTNKEVKTELTPAQRYFYNVNGYVLLKRIFSPAETQHLIDLADQMDADDGVHL